MEAMVGSTEETTIERLDGIQTEVAERANKVGEFQAIFRVDAMGILEEGGDASIIKERIDVIAHATEGQTHLVLAETEEGVLGYNYIGAGDGGARMSQDMFGSITTLDEALIARQAAEHEKRHGDQVPLAGDIVFKDKPVTTWMLFEGDAELFANEQVGWGPTVHRPGQPDDYAEAQDVVYALQQAVGKGFMHQILTQTGDTQALQEALDNAGIGQSEKPDVIPFPVSGSRRKAA